MRDGNESPWIRPTSSRPLSPCRTSPSFARGRYRYTNREYLVITYRTERATLEQAVPEPLTFDEPLALRAADSLDNSTIPDKRAPD